MSLRWSGRMLAALIIIAGLTTSVFSADAAALNARARLTGFQEVPPKLTNGTGTFRATVEGERLTYTLTYSDLSTPATMAHLHFAQAGVNGGIFLWLCGSPTAPGPAGTPTCPPTGGTVTRTVTPSDFVSVPDQGFTAPNFPGVLRILESGDAYANVHSTRFPEGEIRGQVVTRGSD